MEVIEGRTFLEALTPIACNMHLRREDVGRVAVIVDGHPEIFPVNYAVDERGDIFFRTDPGSKLDAVATAPTIAFEIDGIDEDRHSGWSVLAVGPARWLAHPSQMSEARALPMQPWAPGEKTHVVRLSPTKLTGRRIYRPTMSNRHAPVA
jgi:nitroimidazol reductase NimA-like FMN-containing flavoprotein (pyridoxamine 5'-phosphate oxidase superfamily)